MILYNDIEPNALEWLDNLQHDGQLPWGKLDGRSIKAISGADLAGVVQFHTFAGIGGWPLALKLIGWPDDREVWTGSCPCQPYSSAGKQEGDKDPRNLWPDFFRLIAERRPQYVFGEQVASAIKHGWLDRVFADLEGIGYTCGAAVLGAHSVGANHIRQRLYWGAALGGRLPDAERAERWPQAEGRHEPDGHDTRGEEASGWHGADRATLGVAEDPSGLRRRGRGLRHGEGLGGGAQPESEVAGLGAGGGVQDADGERWGAPGVSRARRKNAEQHGGIDGTVDGQVVGRREIDSDARGRGEGVGDETLDRPSDSGGLAGRLGDGCGDDLGRLPGSASGAQAQSDCERSENGARGVVPGSTSPWGDFAFVLCTDGKARRTGAGVFPLAYGLPRGMGQGGTWRKGLARSASRARVGILKGSGNAIVPELAAQFVTAFMESLA